MRVTGEEIDRLAEFLGLLVEDFIPKYTQLASDRRGLMLMEQATGACEFLDGNACRVQPVKPQQCRDFPNSWNFTGWQHDCQAKVRH